MDYAELLKITAIAGTCHDANRAYCRSIGDCSQAPWEFAPEWAVKSAVAKVQNTLKGTTPDAAHYSWMRAKAEDGWKYGEVKDASAKTHPCMVAYEDLPEYQKTKDRIFTAIVAAIVAEH